jgi:ribosomal protein L4
LLLEDLNTEKPRTKDLVQAFSKLKTDTKNKQAAHTLLLLDKIDKNLKLSLRNIGFLSFNLASDTQAYEVMAHKKLIVTKSGLDVLVKRLK